jgi:hypothetical protein
MLENENINESQNPAFLVGAIICSACGGYGYTIEIEANCCGNYKEYGCCGVPNPVQVQVECKCDRGYVRSEHWH